MDSNTDSISGRDTEVTPLALIGGSHDEKHEATGVFSRAFFDWYQASIATEPRKVVDALWFSLSLVPRSSRPQPPYLEAVEFLPESELDDYSAVPVCSLHFGGVNQKVMLRATSDNAPLIAPFVRDRFPVHTVSRADAAIDFDEGPNMFDALAQWLTEYAREKGLKTGHAGDWANGTQGRTLYIGSRKSAVFIRLYEKGLEQISKGADPDTTSPDWCRLEVEIKPVHRSGKEALSTAQPSELFGSSRLLRDLALRFGSHINPLQVGTVRAKTDFERSISHMAYQYGAVLNELLRRHSGDCEAAMADLLARAENESETRSKSRAVMQDAAMERLAPLDGVESHDREEALFSRAGARQVSQGVQEDVCRYVLSTSVAQLGSDEGRRTWIKNVVFPSAVFRGD